MRRHIRHACDSCKRRKAKCDGEPPACSSCRVLGLECEYSTPRAKRGPKPRVSRAPSAPASDSSYSPNQRAGSGTQPVVQITSSPAISSTSPSVSHTGTSPWGPSGLSSTPAAGEWPGTPQVLRPTCCPEKVHEYLTTAAEYHNVDLEHVVRHCIELYCGTAFPIFPVFSSKDIMQSIPLLLSPARHYFTAASHGTPAGEHEPRGCTLDRMRAFTLLTAFCAQMCCRTGDADARPADHALANIFLAASRGMLICYEDSDIAQPVPNSTLIRLAHASVLHCQGKNRQSRFLVGQALRLTVDMRLFDEELLKGLEPREAQIRRNLFWCLYTSDKSLSLLNNLPLTLYDHLADPTQLELASDGSMVRLLDGMGPKYQAPFEDRIRPAFDLSNRQWLLAGDIVRDLDVLSRLCPSSSPIPEGLSYVASSVTRNYTDFCSLLDVTPAWVQNPESHTAEGVDEEATAFQRRAFWAQHANLIVTMHCLKLILMVKAYRQGFAALMGFTENEELFALRNTEVACELVNDSARIPLSALRANGEAMAEKFRSVGVILLEISHRVSNEAIATRAKALFTRLLDLIARLDSRTSDNLGGEAP